MFLNFKTFKNDIELIEILDFFVVLYGKYL